MFFKIYRHRLRESILVNTFNRNGDIGTAECDPPPPSNVVTEDDVNDFFGPPTGDGYCNDNVDGKISRNILNCDLPVHLSFKRLAQLVSDAWKTIDPTSKRNLERRAKLYKNQYRVKNMQWKKMKEENKEATDLLLNMMLRAPSHESSGGLIRKWNPPSFSMDNPPSTISKTRYTLRSQTNSEQESRNVIHGGEGVESSSYLDARKVGRFDHVDRTNDMIPCSAVNWDTSTSEMFDEAKMDNVFDDELSFNGDTTNNANSTVQDTTKYSETNLRYFSGTGQINPANNEECNKDKTLRHVTPEPVQHHGKDRFTPIGVSETQINDDPPDVFRQDFEQSFYSFIPTAPMMESPQVSHYQPRHQQTFVTNHGHNRSPERRHPMPLKTHWNGDDSNTFRESLECYYVPKEEAYQRHCGVHNFKNHVRERMTTTSQTRNRSTTNDDYALRSKAMSFHAGMEQPPSQASNVAHSHDNISDTYSHYTARSSLPSRTNPLSPHGYHSFPNQNPVSQSLPSSLVRLKNALVRMDNAILSACLTHQNQLHQCIDKSYESCNPAGYSLGTVINLRQQSENRLFSQYDDISRHLEQLEFDLIQALVVYRIDQSSMIPTRSCRLSNEGISSSNCNNDHTEHDVTVAPRLHLRKPPAVNKC
jgi:hypothetical protein